MAIVDSLYIIMDCLSACSSTKTVSFLIINNNYIDLKDNLLVSW